MNKTIPFFIALLMLTGQVQAQISNGLVAYYPFSGNANDAVGTIHGTTNHVTLTTDRLGNSNAAYAFTTSGNPSFIDLGNSFNTTTSGNAATFSFSIWFKRSDLSKGMQLLHKHGNNWCGELTAQFAIGVESNGKIYSNYYNASTGTVAGLKANYEKSIALVTDTAWHHLVVTYDGTQAAGQKRATLYLDNAPLASTLTNNGTDVDSIPALGSHLGIGYSLSSTGALCGSNSYGTNGSIDDIRLYNRLLTNCDIKDLYVEGDSLEGVVAHYPFSGNANDAVGTIHGNSSNVTLVADRFNTPNSAYEFTTNGSPSFIDLGNNFNDITSHLGATFSVSIWFKRSNLSRGIQLFHKHGNAWCGEVSHQFAIGVKSNGQIYGNYYDASAGTAAALNANYENSDTTILDTAWHHLVVTYNGVVPVGQKRMHLYLDNLLLASTTTNNGSDAFAIAPLTSHLGIGASLNSNGSFCGNSNYGSDGLIDDIHIYNRLLSDCDVNDLYTPNTTTSTTSITRPIEELVLYPNPAQDWLTVTLTTKDYQNTQLQIINTTGQILQHQTVSAPKVSIPTKQLAKGVYFVRLLNDTKVVGIQKFIKN
ncbi:LamG-like jellyroll fold domain-containing protein [Aureispira anguillae]|uniref:T9SS type A sorting domain-containing protein n=1 Tax=Aureispira anguillae TaxID=2864201 RepID=A0A915VKB0_9BACT|nr:LamG-like jellyroll fold domain-containing protein [Aureispira anguillae]BDS09597.1 T9SS type A sorting domain-containing protein [Aureispira anguillae]